MGIHQKNWRDSIFSRDTLVLLIWFSLLTLLLYFVVKDALKAEKQVSPTKQRTETIHSQQDQHMSLEEWKMREAAERKRIEADFQRAYDASLKEFSKAHHQQPH